MLEGDIVAETKQTIATTSNSQQYGGNKGKIGRDDWDRRGKHNSRYPRLTGHRNEAEESGDRLIKNPRQDDSTK